MRAPRLRRPHPMQTPAFSGTFDFRVAALNEVTFDASDELATMYKLSPCVWREGDRFDLLLRVVNYSEIASEKVARIHHGTSDDGLHFRLKPKPVIAPGEDLPG